MKRYLFSTNIVLVVDIQNHKGNGLWHLPKFICRLQTPTLNLVKLDLNGFLHPKYVSISKERLKRFYV